MNDLTKFYDFYIIKFYDSRYTDKFVAFKHIYNSSITTCHPPPPPQPPGPSLCALHHTVCIHPTWLGAILIVPLSLRSSSSGLVWDHLPDPVRMIYQNWEEIRVSGITSKAIEVIFDITSSNQHEAVLCRPMYLLYYNLWIFIISAGFLVRWLQLIAMLGGLSHSAWECWQLQPLLSLLSRPSPPSPNLWAHHWQRWARILPHAHGFPHSTLTITICYKWNALH